MSVAAGEAGMMRQEPGQPGSAWSFSRVSIGARNGLKPEAEVKRTFDSLVILRR
jgi:hypothetical protein